jgi:hypothetical protein
MSNAKITFTLKKILFFQSSSTQICLTLNEIPSRKSCSYEHNNFNHSFKDKHLLKIMDQNVHLKSSFFSIFKHLCIEKYVELWEGTKKFGH